MGRNLAVALLGWALMGSGVAKAHGAFLVNSTSDHDDGACEALADGDCTLREAIIAANAAINDHPDAPDSIGFDFGLGATAPFYISLQSPLPPIVEGASINGGSEPRYILSSEQVPVIVIDGGGFDHILELRSDTTLVIALAFTNASVSAIDAENADYVLIQGCYFGVDPTTGDPLHPSLAVPAFGAHAIHVRDTFRPRIGGSTEIARNVFAGAGAEAVLVERSDSLAFQRNFVGVDDTGLEARPNALSQPSAASVAVFDSEGVDIWDSVISAGFGGGIELSDVPGASLERNMVGLDATGSAELGNGGAGVSLAGDVDGLALLDNVISANAGPGVHCREGSYGGWRMERNVLGIDATQSDVASNAGDGVLLERRCAGASIGSDRSRNGNLIAHNEGAGVRSTDGTAMIRGNAIFLNGGLSIAVEAEPPPTARPDSGELVVDAGSLTVRACVPSGAIVEVFEALVYRDGTPGALRFLGAAEEGTSEDTDPTSMCSASNDAGFELTIAVEQEVGAVVLTATADGNTSELSEAFGLPEPSSSTDVCTGDSDCAGVSPLCDPVFRRCVSCLNDASDDAVDAGCSPSAPLCTGDPLAERRCEDRPDAAGSPRQGTATSGSSGGGCAVTRSDESAPGPWLLILLAWASLWKRRLYYAV